MAQLGAGSGSNYPNVIDTRQTFRNGTVVLPDSDTRVDSEVLNDSLIAIVNIEETLGAGVQGSYGSVAARLAAIEAGGVGGTPLTNVVAFTDQTVVTLPGAAHQQGQQALFYAVYDASTPRNALAPGSFNMYATTYNAVVTFGVPQSGVFMVAALTPDFVTAFTTPGTPPYTVTIPGTTHGLAETYLFVQAYDAGTPAQAVEPGSLTVHATTRDVTLTFATPQSGSVVLAVGAPQYAQTFTNQTSVVIAGSTHGLGSANLLWTLYAPSGAEVMRIEPGALSVHPTTFEVTLAFAAPQSGTLVLAPVPGVTPVVFAVQPLQQLLALPASSTQRGTDDRLVAQLQRNVERLTARLAHLEALTQTFLLAQDIVPREEPVT